MKIQTITHAALRIVAQLHVLAVRFDNAEAERKSEAAFERATSQLAMVRAAKLHLAKVQDQALLTRAETDKQLSAAYDEVTGITKAVWK